MVNAVNVQGAAKYIYIFLHLAFPHEADFGFTLKKSKQHGGQCAHLVTSNVYKQ